MKKSCLVLAALTILFAIAPGVWGLPEPAGQEEEAPSASTDSKDIFKNLKFRNIGPAVAGGRVASVVGVQGNPSVYYAGAAGGGVFKSTDGGLSWKPIFERESTSSIGAIALAPQNSDWVWVGTGESKIRNDVIDGRGVYFSPDGGQSWKLMGLANVGQIAGILVDPTDPNTVFVGALGHAWGPNPDRGVYRTKDGGKTWSKVLFVDDQTGVADMAMPPNNPKVLFAAMWHARRFPWTLEDGGETSGIYRSTDGGDTWKKLTEGLPKGPYGRSGLAIAPSNPQHIYAVIAAKTGMLWQTLDLGDHWTDVNGSHALDVRPFYFSRLVVSPADENKVYFLSFNLLESDEGGKTFHPADRGVHSDHHALWIDPKNPERMIQGNDGGVFLTADGGKNWRFMNTLPVGQFYQVAADSHEPYNLCGGLQDNSAWCGPSSDLAGRSVTGRNWHTVVGGDGEYSVPAPSDPDIIYSDSQDGSIVRLDQKTHLSKFIRPYLGSPEEEKPADLKYRFNWTSPIAVSLTEANEVYLGANVLFKSTDGGKTWTPISPDLTRNDKTKQEIAGGPVQHDISSAEDYDTIMCITLAPSNPNVIWVGSDDGLVHVTRDGGKNWTNVTAHIPGAPEWARVYQIGVSPTDAGTAYLAYDAHMLDDRRPHVYKTSDYGHSWTPITEGLPNDFTARVVREDPNKPGLLILGTDRGLYYSGDAGGHWQELKANFPTVPVYDLMFAKKQHDLVVATHGRGLFVLDDIRPLEEMDAKIPASDFHLFSAAPGTQFHHWGGFGGGGAEYSAPNAPEGVLIDYYLKSKIETPKAPQEGGPRRTPVKIVITDSKNNPVATVYGPSEAGVNRYVWGMRYDGPTQLNFERPPQSEFLEFFGGNNGPRVLTGTYHIAVTVKGETQETTAEVHYDPNLKIPESEFEAQTREALVMRNQVNALNETLNRLDGMQKQITAFQRTVEGGSEDNKSRYGALLSQARLLGEKLKNLKDEIYGSKVQHDVAEDDIHELADFHGKLEGMARRLGFAYGEAPTPLEKERIEELEKQLTDYLKKYNDLIQSDVAAYNKAAFAVGAPTLFAGEPIAVKPPALP